MNDRKVNAGISYGYNLGLLVGGLTLVIAAGALFLTDYVRYRK